MNRLVLEPFRVQRWLVGSLRWTLAVLAGWVVLGSGAYWMNKSLVFFLVLVPGFLVAHLLLWVSVVRGWLVFYRVGFAVLSRGNQLASLWLGLLALFQLSCLIGIIGLVFNFGGLATKFTYFMNNYIFFTIGT